MSYPVEKDVVVPMAAPASRGVRSSATQPERTSGSRRWFAKASKSKPLKEES